jgi:hypothetical protein
MPFFLIKDPGPFGGRAEVSRLSYKTRVDALNAVKLHRGRWRVVSALSPLDAEKQALPNRPSPVTV